MKHNFDRVIDRRGTHCTQWDYVEDRFGVPDLLPFTISDMDIPSPPSILKALESRVKHGIFGYTRWNHREFKGAVRRWFARRFSADIDEDWIVYSPSVIYACSKLIEMLSEEGDHIVVQTPAYDAFRPMVKALRRRWVPNELKYEKGRYGIDFADLEKKLAHPKAKILLWCSPHNPTGRVWRRWELEEMIRLCRKHRVFVISDEIHMDIVYAPFRHIPVTQAAAGHLEGVFLCTSASKTFNTPGLGGSYAILPNPDIRRRFLKAMKERDGLSSASIPGILATIEGYNHAEDWVDSLVEYLYGNMETVSSFLRRHLPEFQFSMPEATYLAWIDASRAPFTEEALQEALIRRGKVAIMPGSVYGANTSSFLRMNVGCPRSKVLEGLKRMKTAVDQLRRHPGV
ncbi:cystathione beta-lyase [Planifilum fulgidum]|jgi:cystathionine beta-lyase|uniref:cysteine-S-conjugate beta-lyase n=1 Tax=Planifilum fulgidum TaxID=201973 RepID=A0A1I2SU74_9BACL|nr:MalY/PatB family protein [Planifilum fulgidum]MBO2498157.1 pyridoxal phosphate-dependent aminotransferase [Bacillota bacterium]MBO2534088.1 pyridoxal phosphate-dependent aminotransferase [Thermoactinomycetaceae bacterium]SFG56063.1 cystathione beta-lyase [Planifilum fulgidum]